MSYPNSGKDSRKAPRPEMISARPPDSRSRVAKSSKTRTGSIVLSTVVALVSLIRLVTWEMAASTTGTEEMIKSSR
ncbi:hypothetical protein D3C79_926170 [compost metagenome]